MERVLSASAAMLLLMSGDVETNPGPIGRSRSREPKPDPKKIMEEKVGPKEESYHLIHLISKFAIFHIF